MNIYKTNGESIENYLNGRPADNKECGVKKDCGECNICHEEERCVLRANRVTLKCGVPLTTTIPETAAVGDTFNVANLNVDTGKYHNPCIRLSLPAIF